MTLDFRDVFFLAPEIVLTVWGLVVLLVDLGLARRLTPTARRRTIGWLALAGVADRAGGGRDRLFRATDRCELIPRMKIPGSARRIVVVLQRRRSRDLLRHAGRDIQTAFFNILYVVLLGLILGLSMSWSFTEEWGEYFALMFWATVGMMLLTASEELVTLFLTLETMTICLYLSTAMEKTKRRSAEGGLKYFVYGSVSSALFLFGLSSFTA